MYALASLFCFSFIVSPVDRISLAICSHVRHCASIANKPCAMLLIARLEPSQGASHFHLSVSRLFIASKPSNSRPVAFLFRFRSLVRVCTLPPLKSPHLVCRDTAFLAAANRQALARQMSWLAFECASSATLHPSSQDVASCCEVCHGIRSCFRFRKR